MDFDIMPTPTEDSDPIFNHSLCSKCKGYCCRQCGCTLFPRDISSSKERFQKDLKKKIRTGNYSFIIVIYPEGNKYTYQLRLRTRNVNREIIDLFSPYSECSLWSPETGCSFSDQDRPSGGRYLIPQPNHECYLDYDDDWALSEWNKVQEEMEKEFKKIAHEGVLPTLAKQYAKNKDLFSQISENFTAALFSIILPTETLLTQEGYLED